MYTIGAFRKKKDEPEAPPEPEFKQEPAKEDKPALPQRKDWVILTKKNIVDETDKKVEDITLTDLILAAQNEDVLIIELLAELGENLGKGLAVLINVFNPELIIIGGTLSETGEYLKLPIKSSINKYSLSLVNADTVLKLSKLGEKAGIIGACLLAKNKALSII